jgi:hypothetical protein
MNPGGQRCTGPKDDHRLGPTAGHNPQGDEVTTMRRFSSSFAMLALLAATALVGGCGDSEQTTIPQNPATEDTDEGALRAAVDEDADVLGSAQFLGEDQALDSRPSFAGKALSAIQEAINTVRWWRMPTSITKTVDIDLVEPQGDSIPGLANVTVTVDVEGMLKLIAAPDDSTRVKYEKPFADSSLRYAVFERRHPPNTDRPILRRGWQLSQLSCASIESEGGTRQIQSVSATGASGSYTITDPLLLMDVKDGLPAFAAEEEVQVTVVTGDPTDRVFLHSHRHRFEFENNGDGSFTGTWNVGPAWGPLPRCAGIDVLSGPTLGDDSAPYDSRAWIIPYRVTAP